MVRDKKQAVVDEKLLDSIPLKSRLLYVIQQGGEMWTDEATDKLLADAGMKRTNRWLWVIRFYLMELSVNGMLKVLDEKVADESYYGRPDVVITKYVITSFGVERLNDVLGV